MLSCLFGKCSSETYVVNKEPRTGVRPITNGGISIISQGHEHNRSSDNEKNSNGNQETHIPEPQVTLNNNQNQQSNIEAPVTQPPSKQNGQIPTISIEKPDNEQVSDHDRSNSEISNKESQSKSKSQAPLPPPKSNINGTALKSELQRESSADNNITPTNNGIEEAAHQSSSNIVDTDKGNSVIIETVREELAHKTQSANTNTVIINNVTETEEIRDKIQSSSTSIAAIKTQSPDTEDVQVNTVTENGTETKDISNKREGVNIKPTKDSDKRKSSNSGESGFDEPIKRRSGIVPLPFKYDNTQSKSPVYPKSEADEALIRDAITRNDFLSKIITGKRLEDVIKAMYSKDVSTKDTIVKQGEKGSHMYISAKGRFQVLIKNKAVSEFDDVRVFGELAILYNPKRLATIKALTPGKVWVLDRDVYQQIVVQIVIKEDEEILQFLMNNEKLKVAGQEALREVANLLKSEFFKSGTEIVRQGDKGYKFYIIRAGTVTITKDGEGVVGNLKKGDCFGELALLKEDCRQATVTADAPGVECLTLTRKEFIDHFGELKEWTDIKAYPKNSFKDGVVEHEDTDLRDLKIIKTLGVGGFGRVELVQHKKRSELVFALKYLKKIDIVMQHQQEHVYNEKNIQMACTSPFIVRLYRTYKDNKYIYLLMESCLGGDLWSLLQKQKLRRFEEKEARFIAACVLESFEYLHSRGIIYRDLKPENLLIAANGYIKLTDFGFAKKISSRGKTFTFAGTPEYVAPEIVLNRGHDRAVDYWAFGVFIFELLTGRTPFRTDDSSHMKTYNKILSGIDNVQFPSYVNLKARHIIGKLCRPVPSERLGMQRPGIKDIKEHKWFLGFDWQKFSKCEVSSPFKPKLKSNIDTQYFDQFKKDTDIPPDEMSGWDMKF